MTAPRLIVIAGPTATGKSDLALAVAEHVAGEVVNADSMQLYRGMDIGTAKLPVAQRRGIPHHLLDVLDVAESATVAAYQRQARTVIEDLLSRGITPVLTGGSGLYLSAVVDPIEFPGTDPEIRARLESELAATGTAPLRARLAVVDPAAANRIEAADGRRLVRALEVIEITGRPFTAQLPTPGPPRYGAVLMLLDRPTDELDARVAARVDSMVEHGLLDEVRALDRVGLRDGRTASRALGYRQFLDVLDGLWGIDEAAAATAAATRRFVRRQRSWFGRDPRWQRVGPDGVGAVLAEAARSGGAATLER